ncbi:Error-prone repair protein ImuA [Mucilaginibacter sp. KACC 22773]|uniref:ImuA family protein n=1 Tax=Mucilaginibacter sp. KACC 22773 TaxID=3025671 RepID=UPI002366BB3C|nr:Error-prone repair protein ImuA [Mucilaginibacter sp. KACC 22773]WDF79623.1 Error-prone repair protein ImuA [Mucilaginibacter sp. KACC 22773]
MEAKKDIISQLKKDILLWEGFKAPIAGADDSFGLGPIEAAFPNGIFPVGAVHEFLTTEPEHAAATNGFIGGILAQLMRNNGVCLWISKARTVFPPALKVFGVPPERVIFIDLQREKDLLWATEEALKCDGLAAVIAELPGINFTQSRRLQLAVESSKVTGFVLRTDAKKLSTTACVSRWQITHLPSELEDGLPGVGFPRWQVELLKVRNGNPGCWQVEWVAGSFTLVVEEKAVTEIAYHQYA